MILFVQVLQINITFINYKKYNYIKKTDILFIYTKVNKNYEDIKIFHVENT